MTITLTVSGRIASVDATAHVVAGNTYPVALSLDSEWTGSLYLRVRFGSLYYDIPFASSDASVDVQMPVGYPEVGIGVFSEALEICSCEARIRLLRSILEAGEQVVEFDSDLYDQWAGEVSELLCDSDFDAESERPVKNSVLTAWKNTVPVDSALVHKTGNESIAGIKTFEGQGIQAQGTNAYVMLKSTQDADVASWKGNILCYDRKNGAESEVGRVTILTASGFNSAMLRVSKPDRSATYSLEMRAYPTYSVTMIQPFYPVDGQGNPTYLTANALMASGNIAVDPRIVHTTGNETIAGDKTFTGRIYGYRLLSRDTSAYGTGNAKCGIGLVAKGENGSDISYAAAYLWQVYTGENKRNSFSINVKSLDGASESSIEFWKMTDNSTRLFVPSHMPVDGSGNHLAPVSGEAMTSGMIGVDPRIVHTTGNEATAGVKQGDWRGKILQAPHATTTGKWLRYADFGNAYAITLVEIVCQVANNGVAYALGFVGGADVYARNLSIIQKHVNGYTSKVVALKDRATNHNEIWIYVENVSNVNGTEFCIVRSSTSNPSITYPQTEHDTLPDYRTIEYLIGEP